MGAVVRLRDVPKRQTPLRRPNAELRTREHLTEREVEKLIKAATKSNRWGHRDSTMVLLAYRHGLRASEPGSGAAICPGTSADGGILSDT